MLAEVRNELRSVYLSDERNAIVSSETEPENLQRVSKCGQRRKLMATILGSINRNGLF